MKKVIKNLVIIIAFFITANLGSIDTKADKPGCGFYCWCGTYIHCNCSSCAIDGQELTCCGYTLKCNQICI